MNTDLETLYKERRLLKLLVATDRERYSYLQPRIDDIKYIINSIYAAPPYTYMKFAAYDMDLAERITASARESIKEYEEFIKELNILKNSNDTK